MSKPDEYRCVFTEDQFRLLLGLVKSEVDNMTTRILRLAAAKDQKAVKGMRPASEAICALFESLSSVERWVDE